MTDFNTVIVDNPEPVEALIEAVSADTILPIDTEFVRTETFYPLPGLIQIFHDNSAYLIYPEALQSGQLKRLMEKPKHLVLHSGSEDVEVFNILAPNAEVSFFDTQSACGLIGLNPVMSLQSLVEHVTGILLPKSYSRTNWLKRPLRAEELNYAAEDVVHLPEIYDYLSEHLQRLGRLDWLLSDCKMLLKSKPSKPDKRYLSYGDAWRLKPEQLMLFASLVTWREKLAMSENIARNFLFSDKHLYQIVAQNIHSKRVLFDIGCRSKAVRIYGDALLEQLKQPEYDSVPLEQPLRPLSKPEQRMIGVLKQRVESEAKKLEVNPQVLMSKRMLIRLYQAVVLEKNEMPEVLTGWRYDVIVKPCIDMLQNQRGKF